LKSTMRVMIACLAMSLVLCCVSAARADELQRPEQGKKIKVFVLAGQSNMEGRADGTKLTPETRARLGKVQERVQLAFNYQDPKPLDVVKPHPAIAKIYEREFIFGPELFFGMALAEAWPEEKFLFIKFAAGATSLHGAWNPDWTEEKAAVTGEEEETPLYGAMMAYIEKTLSGYDPADYEIRAMLWVQGETDGPSAVAAAAYGENLRNLIGRVRRDLDRATLPFLLFEVGRAKVVKGMQDTAKTMDKVCLLPQSQDPASRDFYAKMENGHYNLEGQKKLGLRFAEEFLR
jgi:hypothetical protein